MNIQLQINESKAEFFLEYLNSLKDGIVEKIEISNENLDLKRKQKIIGEQVENYYNGTSTLLTQDESNKTMQTFMEDLKAKYANS
ncbi:MAG TPA: hypothetical protein ENK82_02415 [Campylobacterales bacterium]|nr:hypothetical protein [Campylobacterales bacterium]HHS92179.1 hypothetical protein [Campylobacterales bacterium]